MIYRFVLAISLLILLTTSCGRKGALEYPEGQKRPTFDNVIFEE